MKQKLQIYLLYELDKYDRTRFIGRYASRHRLHAAIQGLGLTRYAIETEEKPCEYGGYISLRGIKDA